MHLVSWFLVLLNLVRNPESPAPATMAYKALAVASILPRHLTAWPNFAKKTVGAAVFSFLYVCWVSSHSSPTLGRAVVSSVPCCCLSRHESSDRKSLRNWPHWSRLAMRTQCHVGCQMITVHSVHLLLECSEAELEFPHLRGWRKCDHFTLLSTVVLWCSYYVQRLIPISSFHARVLRIASMLASCCSGCMADGKKHRCVCSTQVLCMVCKSGPFGCVGCVWPWGWACSSTVAA